MYEKYFTTKDLADLICEAAGERRHDMTPIFKAVDEIRKDPINELKAAVEAAKTSTERPRTFVVAYRNPRGGIKLAHGVEYSDGEIDVEDGHSFVGGYADTLQELRETADKRGVAYHIDYTDES